MLFQTSLGVDIQDNSVSIACLRASFKGPRLAAHGTYALEREQSEEQKADQIGRLVENFLEENRISPTGIFLGVPRCFSVMRYLELPLAVKEDLRDSLGYEIEKYVPFSGDEIYFDYQVISEDKEAGKMRLLLVVVKKGIIDAFLVLRGRISAGISGIEVSSTAIANYFAYESETDAKDVYALVFLRDHTLELDLFRNRFLDYSRFVNLTENENNLPSLILQELKALGRDLGSREEKLQTIFSGPEANGKLLGSLRDEEGLEVVLADLSKTGIPSSALVAAYGLAIKGIRKVQTDINLLPDEVRKRPSRVRYYTMLVLLGLLLLSAFAWGGGSILFQQLRLHRLNSELTQLEAELERVDGIRTRFNKAQERVEYLNGLSAGSLSALNVLKELSQRIPKSAWVRKFTFSDKGVRIEGIAKSASELIPALERSPLFKDVTFLSSITRNRHGEEFFRIGLEMTRE